MIHGLEKFYDPAHPEFRRAPGEVGTLGEQLAIAFGVAPAEVLPELFMARFASTVITDPIAFGELCIFCAEQAQAAQKAGAA